MIYMYVAMGLLNMAWINLNFLKWFNRSFSGNTRNSAFLNRSTTLRPLLLGVSYPSQRTCGPHHWHRSSECGFRRVPSTGPDLLQYCGTSHRSILAPRFPHETQWPRRCPAFHEVRRPTWEGRHIRLLGCGSLQPR